MVKNAQSTRQKSKNARTAGPQAMYGSSPAHGEATRDLFGTRDPKPVDDYDAYVEYTEDDDLDTGHVDPALAAQMASVRAAKLRAASTVIDAKLSTNSTVAGSKPEPQPAAPVHAPKSTGNTVSTVEVFRVISATETAVSARGRDKDAAARAKGVLSSLCETGMTRPLVMPSPGWCAELDEIERTMPNFAHVVQTVLRPHLSLLERGKAVRLPPLLLNGPPGVGKTRFANLVAKVMGFDDACFVPMASETNGSALAGSSVFWSNSSPGRLFETLAWGQGTGTMAANPVVVLDEIDKVRSDERYNPLGALYSLLEVDTACRFKDDSLPDLRIDASHVRFIATSNDAGLIPEPLLSRMQRFDIAPPSPLEFRDVVRRMFRQVCARHDLPLCADLPDDVIDASLALSPREIQRTLESASFLAASRDSAVLKLAHWLAVAPKAPATASRRIGFCT